MVGRVLMAGLRRTAGRGQTVGRGLPGRGAASPVGPRLARCPTVTGAGARGRRHARRSGRTGTADPAPPGSGPRGSEPRGSGELATDERAGTQPVPALGSEGGAAESGLPASAAGAASAAGTPGGAAARPYGRILIFTLLDDRADDFDRLAEETAEQVRTGEPDTLVYVIHLVPNAPMQRIFYEIYRDRAAFDSHESQPYMQRFVAERRAFVLATNMIELRLKYAKVAPLPSPQPAAAALLPAVSGRAAARRPGGTAAGNAGTAGAAAGPAAAPASPAAS